MNNPTRATIPICNVCGSKRIEVDERSWGTIYECESCGFEGTSCHWGYYPPKPIEVPIDQAKALATVRQWMSRWCRVPATQEAVRELSDALLWSDGDGGDG